jgi:transposase
MHLIYSGSDFVWLYDRCDQLAFLDAHVRAFAYFGGLPQRLAYDNLTPAVRKMVGAEPGSFSFRPGVV